MTAPARPPVPGEFYQIYLRGWRDGAARKPMRPGHEGHPTLGRTYSQGYAAGREAYTKAAEEAATRFRYTPSILRLVGTESQRSSSSHENLSESPKTEADFRNGVRGKYAEQYAQGVATEISYTREYPCGHVYEGPVPGPVSCFLCGKV